MRCRRCQYSLWNIKDRVCPECGEPFLPSEQDFVVNSVKFMCPHCSQDYYGQGDRGHLVPFEFDCVACARRIDMDQMVLLPIEGHDESVTEVDVMPWRERVRVGYIRAWFKTVYRALFTPPVLMRLDPGPSVGSAWLFLIVTHVMYGLTGGLAYLPLLFIGGGGLTPNSPAFVFSGMAIGFLLLLPVMMALLWGLSAHAILAWTGPTEHGLKGTYQAICYASAADIVKSVPCLGTYFFWLGWIWWAISATLMVHERQQVKGWRACLAVLLPLGLVGAALIGLFVLLIYSVMQASTGMASLQMSRQNVTSMGQAILDREASTGAFPTHMLQMLADDTLDEIDFIESPMTQPMNVPIGLKTLNDWPLLTQQEQALLLQDVLDAQPADVIAHRFGDYVFTYHGLDPDADDGDLWIVIASPNPSIRNWTMTPEEVIVMSLDGTVRSLDEMELANEIDLQNVLREAHGLEPLPSPDKVTHDAPVVPGS